MQVKCQFRIIIGVNIINQFYKSKLNMYTSYTKVVFYPSSIIDIIIIYFCTAIHYFFGHYCSSKGCVKEIAFSDK